MQLIQALLIVAIAKLAMVRCSGKYYRIVREGGQSLPPDEIITSHILNEADQMTCAYLCSSEQQCVGFNFRDIINDENCQITNVTNHWKTQTPAQGEWTLFHDLEATIVNEEEKTDEKFNGTPSDETEPFDVYNRQSESDGVFNDRSDGDPLMKYRTTLYESGDRRDGVYENDPDNLGSFHVSCDMKTDGGGWTVLQRKLDASVDFHVGWKMYKIGFGDFNGNIWLGLDKIHRLTTSTETMLIVDLIDFEINTTYAKYGIFSVGSESEDYNLSIGGYIGNAGHSFIYHNGKKFSIIYNNNDDVSDGNCARHWYDGWWFGKCKTCNLNGIYLLVNETSMVGITWYHLNVDNTPMRMLR